MGNETYMKPAQTGYGRHSDLFTPSTQFCSMNKSGGVNPDDLTNKLNSVLVNVEDPE